MKIIKPITITNSNLTSSSIAEPAAGETAWNAATNYSVGTQVIRTTTHKIYENLIAGVDSTNPEDALTGVSPRWLEVGYTNKWRMFDSGVGSASSGSSPITVVITPGQIGAAACIGLSGVTSISAVLVSSSTTVYDQTSNLDGTLIDDWFSYFFEPYVIAEECLFDNIPPYANGVLTLTITGGSPSVGGVIVGSSQQVGDTQYGATLGIIDYSRKETDEFGVTSITPRLYSKRMTIPMLLDNRQIRRVHTLLASIRSTPVLWVGVEADTETYAPMIIYGFYRDFSVNIQYYSQSSCSLDIEGLV